MKQNTTAAFLLLASMVPGAVLADTVSEEQSKALLERLQKLEQELTSLRKKLDNAEAGPSKEVKSQGANNVSSVSWKGAPEVKGNDGWSVKPRGRMLYDFANLSSVPDSMDVPGEGFSNEARRVRFGIQGSMPGGFGYKLETDFSGGADLTDAYLSYKQDGWKFTFGQHNNFQSFEELTSSNDSSFIERAAFTDAFGFERRLGISAETKLSDVTVQAGIFTDNLDDLDDGNNSTSVDMRAFISPKVDGMQMHFGGSYHVRDLGDAIDTVRYRSRPMVHSVDTRFVNTDRIAGAEKENSFGLEAAIIADRFHAQAEMHSVTVDRNGFEDTTFFGGAIEAGYFLTEDTRQYKGGVFKGVKVSEPVGSGGIGAWQVNVRFDRLDLEDADIVGGTQDAYMASLIWTPINNVRFLVQYGHLSYSNVAEVVSGAPNDFSVNVIGARTQVSF